MTTCMMIAVGVYLLAGALFQLGWVAHERLRVFKEAERGHVVLPLASVQTNLGGALFWPLIAWVYIHRARRIRYAFDPASLLND